MKRKDNLMEELAANGIRDLTEAEIEGLTIEQCATALGEEGISRVQRIAALEDQLYTTTDPAERRKLAEQIVAIMAHRA
jgi:hypothetical protein